MADWKDDIFLKVVNVIVFIVFLGSNVFSSVEGYAGNKETYISPAPYAHYIWALTDLLLLGFVIYQFFETGAEKTKAIGWRFLLTGLLSAVYSHLLSRSSYIAAFIISLFWASSISHIYYTLTKLPPKSAADIAFVHLPFSLWHAFSIVAVVLSAFLAFGKDAAHKRAGVWTEIFVAAALAFLALTAVGYTYRDDKGDVAGAIVIAWELLAIFDHQRRPELIHWFALGAFIVADLAIIKAIFLTVKNRGAIFTSDPERAPLVAGTE